MTTKIEKVFDKEKVTVEIINTETCFQWRMSVGKYSTEWTRHYEGVLTLRSKKTNNLYAYATDYWLGTLPTETIFKIET